MRKQSSHSPCGRRHGLAAGAEVRQTGTGKKHSWKIADCLTSFRIVGSIVLLFLHPGSAAFFVIYTAAGLTDALDGPIARKTGTASAAGARLDSIADLLFYTVTLLRNFPVLWAVLPGRIWYAVAGVLLLRLFTYLLAAMKYHLFASLHTYLNKLTGGMVFLIPYLLFSPYAIPFCWAVCVIAAAASPEELAIHICSKTYHGDIKSIFLKEH